VPQARSPDQYAATEWSPVPSTGYYQKGLQLLGKTTFDQHAKVDITTAEQTIEKKRPRGKATAYPDNPEVRDAYEEELRRQALRTVILDEAQHLIQTSDGKQPKDQLNWIKSMTTETGVLHILIGTYDLIPFCNLDGQMARRGLELHFSRDGSRGAMSHVRLRAPG
jgi:AAA domain